VGGERHAEGLHVTSHLHEARRLGAGMTRFVSQTDMSAKDLMRCFIEAQAIVEVCHQVAWDIQNHDDNPQAVTRLSDCIQQLTALAGDLLEPVGEALATHEGLMTPVDE